MQLPPFVYSLAFWKALSYVLAGVLALLVYFGVLPEVYLYGDAAVLAAILAVLNVIQIKPELQSRGLVDYD